MEVSLAEANTEAEILPQDDQEKPEISLSDDKVGAASDEIDEVSPEEGIKDLRRSLEEQKRLLENERRMRAEADMRAYQANVQAANNDHRVKTSNYHEVVSRINLIAERDKALTQELIDAKQMGDYQKEVEINRILSQSVNDMRILHNAKDRLEHELKQPVHEVPPPELNPVEQWAMSMPEKESRWVRSHMDKITDERMINKIRAAHYEAVAEGYEQSSPDYFRYVEERSGLSKPSQSSRRDNDDDEDDEAYSSAAKPRRSSPPPAAPVSRGGDRKGTFRLTQEEREIAKMCGQTEEEYYRQQKRAEKEKRAGAR